MVADRAFAKAALSVGALAGSALFLLAGCTTQDAQIPVTTLSTPQRVSPTTAVSTTVPEPVAQYRSWEGDPRDPGPADWDDPRSRDAALMAIALHPSDVGLVGLEDAQPVPWNTLGAPGYLSDVLPLEAQAGYMSGMDQMFRATYESTSFADDGDMSLFETIVAVAPSHEAAMSFLGDLTAEVDESFDMLASSTVTATNGSFTLTATEDDVAVSLRFEVFGRLMLGVSVVGENDEEVTMVASSAWPLIEARMNAVVDGSAAYGALPSVLDLVGTAMWRSSRTAGGFVGQLDVEGIVSCSFLDAGDAAFSIDADRVSSAHLPEPGAISTGGAPVQSLCGTGWPGRPAPFSTVESRHPSAFLRWLPDLSSLSAVDDHRNGVPSARLDLTEAYARYMAGLTSTVAVAEMNLWLSLDGGWVVAWDATVTGDADDLQRNGFDSEGTSSYSASFEVTDVNTDVPRTIVEGAVPIPPDGGTVAFTSGRVGGTLDIFLTRSDGSILRLTDHPNGDELPAFSPDGSTVVFTSRRSGNESLFLIDSDGTNLRRLTAPVSDGGDSWAQWAPNGDEIVFASDRQSAVGKDDIWIIGVDGSDPRPIVELDHSAFWPTWSPDGTSIAFVSTADASSQQSGLFVSETDGSNVRLVASGSAGERYSRPQWFSDGRRLLVTVEASDGGPTIVILDAQTGQQLFSTPGYFGTVAPDSEILVYTNSAGNIESLDLNTGEQRSITLHGSIDYAPSIAFPRP